MAANKSIARVEQIIGYTFNNRLLCVEALQMSAPQQIVFLDKKNHIVEYNKRLAILGDLTLDKVLGKMWYERQNQFGLGLSLENWSTIRFDLTANKSLAKRGRELGIDSCILRNDGTSTVSDMMVATTIEAVIGAVDQDGGEGAVQKVMNKIGLTSHPLLVKSQIRSILRK
ncbi:ribonuclease III domain-containing protein [Dendryphion nanum]|uniref:Ribonuclease III domain-containing protein n=1 Tax=Dendryphion nanum TaxID=256645 RepID=A0A9P9EB85_9PLEO|nr:ribonuclease III domain-containing protein [Dendryphion nanum]